MRNILIATVIAIAFIAGGYYLSSQKSAEETTASDLLMSASFACADGTNFVAEFLSQNSVRILVDGNTVRTLPKVEGDGQRYEDGMYAYVFAGEGAAVTDNASGVMTTCEQPFDPNNAPVNFGDVAEGAGMQSDPSLAVRENIIGSWQSTEDPSFTRIFNTDGTIRDLYDGEPVSDGVWRSFTAETAGEVAFTPEAGQTYVSFEEEGVEPLYFKVDALTPERLELTYMGRGGVLIFTRTQ
ncbi:MAG TPA: hypothetical protein VEA92_03290 [Candidatus Paceibacterota bacterium]|nr:hypothetical protein [Candidatus Paceibacterota bacterium]